MKKLTLLLVAVAMISGGAFAQDKACCKKGKHCCKDKKECAKDKKNYQLTTTLAKTQPDRSSKAKFLSLNIFAIERGCLNRQPLLF